MPSICFVSYEFFPTTWGGCGVLLHNLCVELLKNGYRVFLLIDVPREYYEKLRDVDCHSLPSPENFSVFLVEDLAVSKYRSTDFRTTFEWDSFRFFKAADALQQSHEIDLFEFFDYCGSAYCSLNAKLAGLSFKSSGIAIRLHNSLEVMDANESNTVHNFARYRAFALEHSALSKADYILSPSKRYLDNAYKPFYEYWAGKEIFSPPPLNKYPKVSARSATPRAFLFYGRLFSWKGIDLFVSAAVSLLKNPEFATARFFIVGYDSQSPPVGQGSYVEYLKAKIPFKHGGNFEFFGQLSWSELEKLLPDVLAAVFPSYFESFCYAAHELYSAGIPVLVSDTPAFRDGFENKSNSIIFKLDTNSLSAAMSRAWKHRESFCVNLNCRREIQNTQAVKIYTDIASARGKTILEETAEKEILIIILCKNFPSKTAFGIPGKFKKFVTIVFAITDLQINEAKSYFLGRNVNFYSKDLKVIAQEELTTRDFLLILNEGDELDVNYFPRVLRAFKNATVGFVSVWGQKVTEPVDALPEAIPFFGMDVVTRSMMRTQREILLIDFFDYRARSLGEVETLIENTRNGLLGVTIPEALMTLSEIVHEEPASSEVSYLVLKDNNPVMLRRRARMAAAMFGHSTNSGTGNDPIFSDDIEKLIRRIVRMFDSVYIKHLWLRKPITLIYKTFTRILHLPSK